MATERTRTTIFAHASRRKKVAPETREVSGLFGMRGIIWSGTKCQSALTTLKSRQIYNNALCQMPLCSITEDFPNFLHTRATAGSGH